MPPTTAEAPFADRLLNWWHTHGRHDLPWQTGRTPYRVWVAEIMLQQTQVATVLPYFERFMARFPDLETLARAELDEVLSLWSGLGYYARGRNLHAAARRCLDEHGGKLPPTPAALEALPGIGHSTANAIVAQAFNRRAVILDGNVKRVVARHAGIDGWPGRAAVLRRLWQAADARTPTDRAADYTQAIMDLGATVCTPRRPDCARCPLAADCIARLEDRTGQLPARKPRRERPRRATTLLILENGRGEILLERRPPAGIWGGLWSLPRADEAGEPAAARERTPPAPVRHQFTHFTLDIRFRHLCVAGPDTLGDGGSRRWMQPRDALDCGLPRPIRQVLEQLG